MIEIAVKDFLAKELDVPVYLEHHVDAPDSYIIIEKTSSGRNNNLENSTIAIQSYADKLYEAAVLNEKVKKAMFEFPGQDSISKVALNSDYNFTDIDTKKYRYQAVFDIYHY